MSFDIEERSKFSAWPTAPSTKIACKVTMTAP